MSERPADVVPQATRPFVDQPVTDIAAADRAARAAAAAWHLPPPRLHRRGMNAIHVAGDVVLRVGRPTAPPVASLELADRLTARGVRVPRPVRHEAVEHAGLTVTAWERLRPTGEPTAWTEVGALVARVHELTVADLPSDHPLPSPTSFPWWDFESLLVEIGPALDARSRTGLEAAVARWPDWSRMHDRRRAVCHGDVHPGNVMMTVDGPVLLDWDLLCAAPPSWDHGPLMTWTERWGGPPGLYEAFAAGYGWSARGDPTAEAYAELRLVAATLMRVRAALVDPAARDEAERRLRHWRGEADAPPWRAR